jgi:hypothetical protein
MEQHDWVLAMTSRLLLLSSGFMLAGVGGCSDLKQQHQTTVEVLDSAGVSIVHSRIGGDAPTCEVGDETMRIGALDEDQGTTLFAVNGVALLSDGRIAVVNRGTSQIKLFSPDGHLINEFGRQGPGPGEFKNLWSVFVREGDTLVVGDYRPWRFSFFTPDGVFLRMVELRPAVIERPDFALPLASGDGFVMEEPSFEVQDEMVDRVVPLWRYGEDGERSGSVGEFWLDRFGFLSKEIGYVGNPIFGARASFVHLRGDLFLYGTGRFQQLEVWSTRGDLQRIVRWDSRDREVGPGDADVWRRLRREEMESHFEITPEMEPVIQAQIGEHIPVADLYPGHDRVVVSSEGVIWVQEFRRPLDEGPDHWWVFGPDGGFRCSVSLPQDLFVLAVGTDRIFALTRDDFDVEYLLALEVEYARSVPGS